MRSSGVLLHISSLPSPYGIGTLGKAAYDFADFLYCAGQHYWQILPIGPTSYGDSPYQSFSTCAGNPYFIDLDRLVQDGLLQADELAAINWAGHEERVDYGFQFSVRFDLLRRAFARGAHALSDALQQFRREQPWVEDYALYMAIKSSRNMESWLLWPEDIRLRKPEAVKAYRARLSQDVDFYIFLQYLFFCQWDRLRDYVHCKGLEIIGDLPIYVPLDSCDVWANPSLFQLREDGTPSCVAGVPPDYFSRDGQLWGNPLYDWDTMATDGYRWWKERIAAASRLFDVIRIDHFRGLESYWSVPSGEETARNGKWVKGPGNSFIAALKQAFPHLRLIAEDLGFLTPEVIELQKSSGFPGMKVLEFAFDPREPSNYLPHRYERNCICYSGTHDNETLAQWQAGQSEQTLSYAMEYLRVKQPEDLRWAILCAGISSIADTFIAQMQDYLGLGAEARMNEPGILSEKNWNWRLKADALTPELAQRMRRLTQLYER